MSNLYVKWVWWEEETQQVEVPVLVYSKINADDLEIERFAFYRSDRVWGYCDDPKATGRTMLTDVPTGLANPEWGVDKINAHARESDAAYHLSTISAAEFYAARNTHIGMAMPENV